MSELTRKFIAHENITWCEQQISTSVDERERRLLVEMLQGEKEKLSAAKPNGFKVLKTSIARKTYGYYLCGSSSSFTEKQKNQLNFASMRRKHQPDCSSKRGLNSRSR